MSVPGKHGLYGLTINATHLGGITNQAINTGSELVGEPTSGGVYPSFVSLVTQNPGINTTTHAIAAALGLVGVAGAAIAGAGVSAYAYAHAAGATRGGASLHKKYTFNAGMQVLRTLSCEHGKDAQLTLDTLGIYDGTHDPIVLAELQSVPTLTDLERFTLGPITIGGIALTGVRRVEIDFGVSAAVEGSDGDVWPTFVSIDTIKPMITIRGIDPHWLKDTGGFLLEGGAATHANTAIYLRKRAIGGTFVADATAEHVLLTACGMAVVDTPFDAGGEAGETELKLTCYHDGTNIPIIIDTTAALP